MPAAWPQMIADYEGALPAGGWPNWVLGNHDRPRIADPRRRGAGAGRDDAAASTLRGTPTLYYGDELGIDDVADSRRNGCRIRASCNEPGIGRGPRSGAHADGLGRARNAGLHAPPTPWLPLHRRLAGAQRRGAARRSGIDVALHPGTAGRCAAHVRRWRLGDYHPVAAGGDLLACERRLRRRERLVVALNLGGRAAAASPFPNRAGGFRSVLVRRARGTAIRRCSAPNEGYVLG